MTKTVRENVLIQVFNGDSLYILKNLPDNSIGSIVTDPPYGISFMGRDWDKALPPEEIWKECFRVLKPGGYILAFSATRTYHRLAVQLEDIGFTTHPMIGWIFGQGFPKATDLGKQFNKDAKAKREVIGKHPTVKPIKLMEYLVRLITPPNEICLDPFMGSGTTGIACKNENRKFIGIERETDFYELSIRRLGIK